jgi:hypothetical protein
LKQKEEPEAAAEKLEKVAELCKRLMALRT